MTLKEYAEKQTAEGTMYVPPEEPWDSLVPKKPETVEECQTIIEKLQLEYRKELDRIGGLAISAVKELYDDMNTVICYSVGDTATVSAFSVSKMLMDVAFAYGKLEEKDCSRAIGKLLFLKSKLGGEFQPNTNDAETNEKIDKAIEDCVNRMKNSTPEKILEIAKEFDRELDKIHGIVKSEE